MVLHGTPTYDSLPQHCYGISPELRGRVSCLVYLGLQKSSHQIPMPSKPPLKLHPCYSNPSAFELEVDVAIAQSRFPLILAIFRGFSIPEPEAYITSLIRDAVKYIPSP